MQAAHELDHAARAQAQADAQQRDDGRVGVRALEREGAGDAGGGGARVVQALDRARPSRGGAVRERREEHERRAHVDKVAARP